MFTPLFFKPKLLSISKPAFTSSIGSADNETRIVSPIPSSNNKPKPIDDFTVPENNPPASVIPKCNGYSHCLARSLYHPTAKKISDALTLILKLFKFFSSNNVMFFFALSTSASGQGSLYFSNISFSKEPPLTPILIEQL